MMALDLDTDHSYSCELHEVDICAEEISEQCESDGGYSRKDDDEVRLVKNANSSGVIWTYFGFVPDKNGFPIDIGKPRCRECSKEISCKNGNTSNLFKHLKDRHPSLYTKAQVQQSLSYNAVQFVA